MTLASYHFDIGAIRSMPDSSDESSKGGELEVGSDGELAVGAVSGKYGILSDSETDSDAGNEGPQNELRIGAVRIVPHSLADSGNDLSDFGGSGSGDGEESD